MLRYVQQARNSLNRKIDQLVKTSVALHVRTLKDKTYLCSKLK